MYYFIFIALASKLVLSLAAPSVLWIYLLGVEVLRGHENLPRLTLATLMQCNSFNLNSRVFKLVFIINYVFCLYRFTALIHIRGCHSDTYSCKKRDENGNILTGNIRTGTCSFIVTYADCIFDEDISPWRFFATDLPPHLRRRFRRRQKLSISTQRRRYNG